MKRLLATIWAPLRQPPVPDAPPPPSPPVVEPIATAPFFATERETGAIIAAHICVFALINGVRGSYVETTSEPLLLINPFLLIARTDWQYHGVLPQHATRVGAEPKAQLIPFPGGAA